MSNNNFIPAFAWGAVGGKCETRIAPGIAAYTDCPEAMGIALADIARTIAGWHASVHGSDYAITLQAMADMFCAEMGRPTSVINHVSGEHQ